MNYFYQLTVTISFTEDIPLRNTQETLSKLINTAMSFDDKLRELHPKNQFKGYTFSYPWPIEKERIYFANRHYCFNIRASSMEFIVSLKNYLPKATGQVKIITSELKTIEQKLVTELISLSPIICTVADKCWMAEDGLPILMERLQNNMIKKIKEKEPDFQEPKEYFFESFEILNERPVIVAYKNTTLLGHKIKLTIKSDECSQKMAVVSMAEGVLEKNSVGFGYCISNIRG